MPRIVVQAALALPYAARNLDAEAAAKLRGVILAAEGAIQLAELDAGGGGELARGFARAAATTSRRRG